jgi:hypothetical protein
MRAIFRYYRRAFEDANETALFEAVMLATRINLFGDLVTWSSQERIR